MNPRLINANTCKCVFDFTIDKPIYSGKDLEKAFNSMTTIDAIVITPSVTYGQVFQSIFGNPHKINNEDVLYSFTYQDNYKDKHFIAYYTRKWWDSSFQLPKNYIQDAYEKGEIRDINQKIIDANILCELFDFNETKEIYSGKDVERVISQIKPLTTFHLPKFRFVTNGRLIELIHTTPEKIAKKGVLCRIKHKNGKSYFTTYYARKWWDDFYNKALYINEDERDFD